MKFGASWVDFKLGGRMLVKYPGLTLIGGITLAVAIGVGAAWFEVTRQIVNPRIPLADGDRIVTIANWDAAESEIEARSLYDFQLWREQLTSIRELGAYRAFERNLITPDGIAQPTEVAEISAAAFPLTRVPPLLGRTLQESDAVPGAADVVVIGYDIWQNRFKSDRSIIGQTVRVGRTPATIVGVMPEGFRFPVIQQLWLPLRLSTAAPRTGAAVSVFGRLADGASLESAQAELTTIGQRIAAVNATTHAQLRPFVSRYGGPGPMFNGAPGRSQSLLIRMTNIIAWLILAGAGMNVATLMFARTATRESEIIVRNALGASRKRVMMQLLVEAFVLCTAAAVVGLLGASFALDYAVRLFAVSAIEQVPFWWQFSIGPVTVLYALILAIGAAVVVGLLPAIRATGPRVQNALTQMSTGGTSIKFGGVWSVMIVLQVAFAALCLPFGFAAAFASVFETRWSDRFPTNEYLTFRPELDPDALPTTGVFDPAAYRTQQLTVFAELKRRLENEPSVTAVTFANGLPGTSFGLRQVEVQRGSEPPVLVDASIEGDRVRIANVDNDYFDAFQFPLVAGRAFNTSDVGAETAVIINETLARNLGGNPLGKRIRYAEGGPYRPVSSWYEVVGVVRDIQDATPADFIFQPTSAADVTSLTFAVHTRGDAAAIAPRLRAIATEVEPGLRLYNVVSLHELLRQRERPAIQLMIVTVSLVLVVLALSAAGLYSLMSVAVTRRTREIGIRLAIGASPRAVLGALFARAAIQVGIGIVLANALLPALMTALGIMELKLNIVLGAMLIASLGMLLVGLIACGVPARRALRIQATEAMRYAG
ncbi:MAG: ABC transporter permease [Gemmatimonadota bacterium]